ncbi:MAG: hypothetical protein ACI9MR_000413 [Myxococcota bacterium]|jgi:hypothetical protein
MNDRTKRQGPAAATQAGGVADADAQAMTPRMVQMDAGGNQAACAEGLGGGEAPGEQAMEPTTIKLSGIPMPTYLSALRTDWPVSTAVLTTVAPHSADPSTPLRRRRCSTCLRSPPWGDDEDSTELRINCGEHRFSIHDVASAYDTATADMERAGGVPQLRQDVQLLNDWADALKLDIPAPKQVALNMRLGLNMMLGSRGVLEKASAAETGTPQLVQQAVTSFEAWAGLLGPNAAIAEAFLPEYFAVSLPDGKRLVTRDANNLEEIQDLGTRVGNQMTGVLSTWNSAQTLLGAQRKAHKANRIAYAVSGILSGAEAPHAESTRA